MKSSSILFPYERQEDPRKCGAASLCMVYRGLGQPATQAEVWPRISSEKWCARSHLLAKDAIDRGLQALVIQTTDRWSSLRRCQALQTPAIVNHRFEPTSPRGHYSLFLSTLGDRALFHDPFHGPGRTFSPRELDAVWSWQPFSPEVAGDILIPIGPERRTSRSCSICSRAIPDKVTCPRCKAEIPLGLASILGCADRACDNSVWKRVFCPHCDMPLTRLDGEVDAAEELAGKKSKILLLVDHIKERVQMAADLAPDDATRQAFQAMAEHCDSTGPELQEMLQQLHGDLKNAAATYDNLDQVEADAKKKVAAKKAARAKAQAEKLAARLKIKEEKLAPPTLDDDALRLDVLHRFGLPTTTVETCT